ncbi:MAG: hypothetical protein JWM90_1707 [Thermoleophilia bacterium]|nr:hypothetical protein [Thermoleophilia bacterium]
MGGKLLIVAVLAAALALLALPLQVGAAPSAAYMRAEGTNPTITQKILAYDRMVTESRRVPDVLVLGSSRSVMIDPVHIRRVSGMTSFNAGISNGAARELLALTHYADLRSPGALPHLVIFLDLEAFDGRTPTVRVLDYQQRIDAVKSACGEPTECRTPWLAAARAIARDAVARQAGGRPYTETQRPDGRQINGNLQKWEAQGIDLDPIRARRIQQRIDSYDTSFDRLYPEPQRAFEQLLELANARDVQPVLVVTAMHPDCIRRCGVAGWTARRAEVRAYLEELEQEFDLRWYDFSLPVTWGGSGAQFLDEIHLRDTGANLVVDRIEALGGFERPDAAIRELWLAMVEFACQELAVSCAAQRT